MKTIKYILFYSVVLLVVSCQDFMTPNLDNYKSDETVNTSRNNFLGVLYTTYTLLPTRVNFTYEAATDNAVNNTENSLSSKAARGGVSYTYNPFGENWTTDYKGINYVNYFLEKMVLDTSKAIPTPVRFDVDPIVNLQWFYFTMGEAYFMRAWFEFDLLQKYGGVAADGKTYGFPITTSYLDVTMQLDRPRNTYAECVERITADCDSAIKYLPVNYNKSTGLLSEGVVTQSGHASGIAAHALKTRTLLYAASPAYNPDNDVVKWKESAKAALDAITASGSLLNLQSFINYYSKSKLNDGFYNNPDIFFRGPISQNVTTYESENFPPRASSGKGTINPSQDFVDAFLMRDGYPITATSASFPYDPSNAFKNRDSRLELFIVHSGETYAGITIDTSMGGLDAYGSSTNATRTGYYLQKLLDGSVSLSSGSVVTTTIAPILLGRPELYLNFAEAVLNATGSPDDRTYTYSARDVLILIRNRALGNATADKYLKTVMDKNTFLQIIKNERRIELSFEDHRFWDLRRWSTGLSDMGLINTPVHGIYTTNPLEIRQYKSPYMPLPYGEMLKSKYLINNVGW